jgi:hypothetical protein
MREKIENRSIALLITIAGATVIVHLLLGNRYGFHRDELATLDDARHLAWGYVAYPPVTPFFAWLSWQMFGTSIAGFRFFAALADAGAVLLTGLMARELGGRTGAQMLAACAAIPFCLATGTLMQYVSFDYLAWVACGYFFIRLCQSEDPRWWLAIAGCIGFGMLTKYSMLVCVAGITIGVLFTKLRRHLTSKWLWLGAAVSLLVFLPNFLWQLHHHFISLDFLRHIHERDVRIGRTKDFLPDQLQLTLFTLPVALAGLWFYFFASDGSCFRAVGWLYIIPLLLFLFAHGRGYYLAPAYPVLYAGGAVWIERVFRAARRGVATAGWVVTWSCVVATVVVTSVFALPLAPVNSPWWQRVVALNDDFAEEIGWNELVETVAKVRDALPPNERDRLAILAGNYGEAGAINLYGPRYGLPRAICGTNSFWARGYGDPPPETLIVIGESREFVAYYFESYKVVAKSWNRYGVANEETTRHPEIFLCWHLRTSWPEFWKTFRRYG